MDRTSIINPYNGCLSYLKDRGELNLSWPDNIKTHGNEDIYKLIGVEGKKNIHNLPYTNSPIYLTINISKSTVFPTLLFLEGRNYESLDYAYLKSYEFLGLTVDDKWIRLYEETNKPFTKGEKRFLKLKTKNSFKAFRLNMTGSNTNNNWALTANSIEVFGIINGCVICSMNRRFYINNVCFLFVFLYN